MNLGDERRIFSKVADVTNFIDVITSRSNPSVIIDIGCGENQLSKKFPQIIGVDLIHSDNISVTADVSLNLPFRDSVADALIINQAIEHIEDIPKFMDELYRICKNDVLLWITTPHFSCMSSWVDPTHKHHLAFHSLSFTIDEEKTVFTFPKTEAIFSRVRQELTFHKRFSISRLLYMLSPRRYEKYYCRRWPASGILWILKTKKIEVN